MAACLFPPRRRGPAGSLDAHQLVASRSHPGALLMQQPGGGLWLLGEGGTPKVMEAVRVGSAAATLGSGVSVDGGTWLFLNAAQVRLPTPHPHPPD